MKKHNLLKVILITLLVVVLLTWILPVTGFNPNTQELVDDGLRDQAGIFTLKQTFTIVLQSFSEVSLYILVVGGLYGILYKIPAYRNLLDRIVKLFKHSEKLFIIITMILFAVISSMAGVTFGLLLLFPFVISIILLMGYDKVTAAMVTVGSTIVGLIGTVFASWPLSGIEAIVSSASTMTKSLAKEEIIAKLVLLVLGIVILIFNTLWYAKKHKDTKNIQEGSYVPNASSAKKQAIWPMVLILDLMLVILILSFLSWSGVFELAWFEDATDAVLNFKLFGFEIFGKLLGGSSLQAFGDWTLYDLSAMIMIMSALLAFIYRIKFNEFFDGFFKGAKRAIKPAIIVALVYGITVLASVNGVFINGTGSFVLTIVKPILTITKGFNVATTALGALITSFFGVDPYYSVIPVLPYALSLVKEASYYPLIALIWQAMYGLVSLIAPTSVVLMATLAYLHVPYKSWLKAIWMSFLLLLAVLLIVFLILFAIL